MKNTCLLLLFLMHGPWLEAADYYVSPMGDDVDAGSLAEPWQTLAYAVTQLAAGDVLYVRGGIYAERLLLVGMLGTSNSPVRIAAYEGEEAILDGSTLTVPSGGRAGLVVLEDCSYVTLSGLTVRNYKTANANRIPVGIQVEGQGMGLVIEDCQVHGIWQSSTNSSANGFGIAVYGTDSSPIEGLVIRACEVYDLRTGQSESVVLNGHVTGFLVEGNQVYDCNNIGIDFIGYEGTAPTAYDRARDGVCVGNVVHGIDSRFNPGYGGDFTTGGGDASAAGIYVDGGTDIVIERNEVYGCNFGIELASEDASGFTDYIVMRNNVLHHNLGPGIIMGGYDSARGTTRFCEVANNTLFRNDVLTTYGGQIALQFYLEDNVFRNNVVWASAATKQMVIHYVLGGTAAQRAFDTASNRFDYNVYFCEGSASGIEFGLNATGSGSNSGNQSYYGLAAWRAVVGSDTDSVFQDPGFVVAVPSETPAPSDFKLSDSSLSRDAGEPAPSFMAATGEKDFFGASRVAGGRVDVGCHEWMSALQTWRDTYFQLPDGGGLAGDLVDAEGDGVVNLLEYSQGMNPLLADAEQAPQGRQLGTVWRFQYRKEASELLYEVLSTTDLHTGWSAILLTEESDGEGNYWRDFPLSAGDKVFGRLQVTLP